MWAPRTCLQLSSVRLAESTYAPEEREKAGVRHRVRASAQGVGTGAPVPAGQTPPTSRPPYQATADGLPDAQYRPRDGRRCPVHNTPRRDYLLFMLQHGDPAGARPTSPQRRGPTANQVTSPGSRFDAECDVPACPAPVATECVCPADSNADPSLSKSLTTRGPLYWLRHDHADTISDDALEIITARLLRDLT